MKMLREVGNVLKKCGQFGTPPFLHLQPTTLAYCMRWGVHNFSENVLNHLRGGANLPTSREAQTFHISLEIRVYMAYNFVMEEI